MFTYEEFIVSIGLPFPPVIENKENEISFPDYNLKWSTPYNNGYPLSVYTVYYKEITSPVNESHWYRINTSAVTNALSALPLDCDTKYEFAVSAWNKLGESSLSQPWQTKSVTGIYVAGYVRFQVKSVSNLR